MAVNQIFDSDFQLQKGSVLPDAKLGYLTLGELNEAATTSSSRRRGHGAAADVAFWLTGPGRALDPSKYFIVIPNHFGAAVWSFPSNPRRRSSGPASRGRRATTTSSPSTC